MIPSQQTGREVESTIVGETVDMQIAPEARAHLMSVLTNLYGDSELAVLREYSTNALDAQIEAGYDGPIEITLPSQFAPFLTIRDHGTGISVEGVHNIYSQYGVSTKRQSNDYNGTLGLGCKSALAYCDQFTLTSVKDGTKVCVVIARKEDGTGGMTITDTSSTDEANGTTITIPVKRDNSMAEKAAKFFAYWPEGSVLLNGKAPARFDGLKITDDLYIIEGDQSYAVMGHVAYPVEVDLPAAKTQYGYNPRNGRYGYYGNVAVVAFVPNGSMTFAPDRESLITDAPNTKAAIAKIAEDYAREVGAALQREIDTAATPAQALNILVHWGRYLDPNKAAFQYTYRGTEIPARYKPEDDNVGGMLLAPWDDRYGKGKAEGMGAIQIHDWPGAVWVEGFVPEKFAANHKDKLRKWCEQQGLTNEQVKRFIMLRGEAPDSVFVDKSRIVKWEVVRSIKLDYIAEAKSKGYRIPGSYDFYVGGVEKKGRPGSEIDQTNRIFYANCSLWQGASQAALLHSLFPGCTVMCLPANRIGKFIRDVPTAKSVREGIHEAFATWRKRLTAKQRHAIAIHDASLAFTMQSIDPSKVNDPNIVKLAKAVRIDVSTLLRERKTFSRWGCETPTSEQISNHMDAYPLVKHNRSFDAHDYWYMNAVYAARQAGELA